MLARFDEAQSREQPERPVEVLDIVTMFYVRFQPPLSILATDEYPGRLHALTEATSNPKCGFQPRAGRCRFVPPATVPQKSGCGWLPESGCSNGSAGQRTASAKKLFLRIIPGNLSHFLGAGAGIKLKQEWLIFGLNRAQVKTDGRHHAFSLTS